MALTPQDLLNTWTQVDDYIAGHLIAEDDALKQTLRSCAAAGMPNHHVSAAQGKMLHVLARSVRAKAILEIGTLAGYSSIWLARALPKGGKLTSLEFDPKHAGVAHRNLVTAGVSDRIEIRVGPALETLPKMMAEGCGPFDFIFIDADKPNNSDYVTWALKLSHPGTMIIVDNVIRGGNVLDAKSEDPGVHGSRHLHELLSREPRLAATTIQTVGAKGYDGFTLAVVLP